MQVYRKQKGQSIAEFVIASGVMGINDCYSHDVEDSNCKTQI